VSVHCKHFIGRTPRFSRKAGAKVSTFCTTAKYFKGNFYQKMQKFSNPGKIKEKTPYYII
ncbi:MAG: hypothetical protein IJL37_04050, partial [Bacteroidaceae bacterium]|nr:hypothetical protein [Bacteroidaceae bacterium]